MKPIQAQTRYVPWLVFVFLSLAIPGRVFSNPVTNSPGNTPPANSSIRELRMNEVNQRAARHFYNHFSHEGNEKWTLTDGLYIASESNGETILKAYYNEDGAFVHCCKYYTSASLCPSVSRIIRKKFKGYEIGVVTEFTTPEEHIYSINIRNSSNMKTVRVNRDSIETTEDFVNGSR